jgi:hypothetical protein
MVMQATAWKSRPRRRHLEMKFTKMANIMIQYAKMAAERPQVALGEAGEMVGKTGNIWEGWWAKLGIYGKDDGQNWDIGEGWWAKLRTYGRGGGQN